MKTEEIANRLVELCRKKEWQKAQRELYSDDIVSIEPHASPGFEKETRGLPAILEKSQKFDDMIETMHSIEVSDPMVAGDSFACTMTIDTTMKGQGRMKMSELCVYVVRDGRVVSEQFFM
jgi:ketosteroid isomerase-like protein